jgi:predicted nicotinamide N-methyase
VTTRVEVGGRRLVVEHPPDAEALLDEEAFEREEFLPYWAELWPSAIALARHVARRDLAGLRVLELGCGLALPSVAAALAGARVLATDWSLAALMFAQRNATLNDARVETALARWDEPEQLSARGPFDLVLAADVLYERRNVEQLVVLLAHVVRTDGEALIADPGRPHTASFLDAVAAKQWATAVAPDPLLPRGGVYRLSAATRF